MGIFSRIKRLWVLSGKEEEKYPLYVLPTTEEKKLPCPHGRTHWGDCPHCLGINIPGTVSQVQEPVNTGFLASEEFAEAVEAIGTKNRPKTTGKKAQIIKKKRGDVIDDILDGK